MHNKELVVLNEANFINKLPKSLNRVLKNGIWQENTIGCSNSKVFYIKGISSYTNAYLKVMDSSNEELEKDAKILEWLKDKLPVPEVYYYEKYDGREYLLISEIEGFDASNFQNISDPKKLVTILAEGMRLIHNVDITNCPFNQTLDVKIADAKKNVENGFVDEDDFQPEHLGRTAEEIYKMVLDKRPRTEDLVFTHGDYCLPNIIIRNKKLSGFIDLGRSGIADKYQDIALLVRSLKYKFKVDNPQVLIDIFFEKYGLSDIDYSKIEYYILLDELF